MYTFVWYGMMGSIIITYEPIPDNVNMKHFDYWNMIVLSSKYDNHIKQLHDNHFLAKEATIK